MFFKSYDLFELKIYYIAFERKYVQPEKNNTVLTLKN